VTTALTFIRVIYDPAEDGGVGRVIYNLHESKIQYSGKKFLYAHMIGVTIIVPIYPARFIVLFWLASKPLS
jgi:hypothetical protein